eukprot:g13699.t1
MRAVSTSSWKPANLDKIQQLASAASAFGAGFGDIGYSQADLKARAEREAREKERAAKDAIRNQHKSHANFAAYQHSGPFLKQEALERQRVAEAAEAAERQRKTREAEEKRQEEERQRRLREEEEERLQEAARAQAARASTREVVEAADELAKEDPFNAPGNAAAAEAAARTDVYSDDEIDDDFEVVDLDTFDVDDLVVVREDFISDSDGGEELLRGQRGQIIEIDDDGDAYIRFREHRKKQWVYSQNFGYLAKVLFDKGDDVIVRRSFENGSFPMRRGQSGRVCRVDAGGDVLIDFHGDLREQWAARPEDLRWTTGDGADYAERQEKPKSAAASAAEAKLWLYNPPSFRDVAIRATPSIEGPRTSLTMRPGQRFMVSEELVGEDGILYLKLADGTGWMFQSKPGSGTLCVPQAGGMPKDLLSRLQGRAEDDDKIMHVEDAKGLLISMDKVLSSKPVQSLVEGLLKDQPAAKQHLTEVQKGQEMELMREKAKRIVVDASKGLLKRFGFEVSQEGQQELLEALREHQHDDTVYIVATNIEMALQIPAGGWFGLTQLRKGSQVSVNHEGPPERIGQTGTLERLQNDGWRVRIGGEVIFLMPEQLDVELQKQRQRKVELRDEDLAAQARLMAAFGAAKKALPSCGRMPDQVPWWESCKDRASARANSRTQRTLPVTQKAAHQVAFCESLKQERKAEVARARADRSVRAIEDAPVLPLPMIIEEIEAAEHQEQVQRNFRALARAGLQRLCLALKKAPDLGELRSAEASAQRGDLRPLLRQQKFACARKDATLQLMTGAVQGDPGLLALEGRNDELPPRLTRAQCAQEEFERQRARWHLPPRGKHVGYMPQAHALGAGNLGAVEEGAAPSEGPEPRAARSRAAAPASAQDATAQVANAKTRCFRWLFS